MHFYAPTCVIFVIFLVHVLDSSIDPMNYIQIYPNKRFPSTFAVLCTSRYLTPCHPNRPQLQSTPFPFVAFFLAVFVYYIYMYIFCPS